MCPETLLVSIPATVGPGVKLEAAKPAIGGENLTSSESPRKATVANAAGELILGKEIKSWWPTHCVQPAT